MPKELQIESGSRGERGLIFLYASTLDENKKMQIDKAYKSLNPFNTKITKCPYFEDIYMNRQKYENDEDFKEDIELGKQYFDNYIKYGYCNWYNWAVNTWGTKWNVEDSVDVKIIDDNYEINFDTAWTPPYGIIEEYSKLCKDEDFYWEYINEDYDGQHVLTKENGRLIDSVYYDYDSDI